MSNPLSGFAAQLTDQLDRKKIEKDRRERERREKQSGKGFVDAVAKGAPVHFGHSSILDLRRQEFEAAAKEMSHESLARLNLLLDVIIEWLKHIDEHMERQNTIQQHTIEVLQGIMDRLPPEKKAKR